MHLLTENIYLVLLVLTPSILLMIIGFHKKHKELKVEETKKLEFLYYELVSEKKLALQIKNTSKKVHYLEKSIQNKLLRIKIDIFNLDFTLSEIF